MNIEKKIAN